MDICVNLEHIIKELPRWVKLVAVSKTKPIEDIEEAYRQGQRVFGENKVQELVEKEAILPKDVEWHFIGHLQTNKVKFIVPFVSMIHAIDSPELLAKVNREAEKVERTVPCLLQFYIAQEESKYGMDLNEIEGLLSSNGYKAMNNIKIVGVMGVATNTDDREQVRGEFRRLRETFDYLKRTYFSDDSGFKEVSMGMSHDYRIAVEEGSTMVRIGSSIFGERDYGTKS